MFKTGENVQQEFGNQVMRVIGYEPELIENIVTQWQDGQGTIVKGKFMESQLIAAEQ